MITIKKITLSWLLLISLTLVSIRISSVIDEPRLLTFIALFIVFLKAQQIIDNFMELKHAPRKWRFILLSYIFFTPGIIFLIYII
ncbi:cytochrome C oxidase subunit IV family protein [Colwellia sp. BRX10-3]|uniref:cytochrome C oxidase subunit IV family protein n=1 Tax=Colwellia sp. BRX10-3 TaxID=2759844 RepID=UPI0015F47507|nr:cytochrome C oxidase subunit IV family protein [Colwellia sp. BRX10-3]